MKRQVSTHFIGLFLLFIYSVINCIAYASTTNTTFDVTATVISSCGVSANDLTFGNYDIVTGSAVSGTTTVSVICTSGTTYEIALDEGIGTGANVTTRKMTSGANTLNYGLFSEASHTTVWGKTAAVDTVGSTGTGIQQNFTVYGQVEANQSVPAGTYSDTITVTVTF